MEEVKSFKIKTALHLPTLYSGRTKLLLEEHHTNNRTMVESKDLTEVIKINNQKTKKNW